MPVLPALVTLSENLLLFKRATQCKWPAGWGKIEDPVVPLVLALYGHPSSGAHWEERCDLKVCKCGFVGIGDCGGWRSCYHHPTLDVLLIVYVDDFKMAGPESAVTKAWNMLRTGEDSLDMEDPVTIESYLGCAHELTEHVTKDGVKVKAVKDNMEGQFVQGLKRYKELAGISGQLPKVDTPFLAEGSSENVSRSPSGLGEGLLCPWCKGVSVRTNSSVAWMESLRAPPLGVRRITKGRAPPMAVRTKQVKSKSQGCWLIRQQRS